jgi:mannose/fructose/N-acetylgalactosamine-specific phosphotransferase system component IIC
MNRTPLSAWVGFVIILIFALLTIAVHRVDDCQVNREIRALRLRASRR